MGSPWSDDVGPGEPLARRLLAHRWPPAVPSVVVRGGTAMSARSEPRKIADDGGRAPLNLWAEMQSIGSTPAPLGLLVRRWPERRALLLGSAAALFVAVFASMALADDATFGLA